LALDLPLLRKSHLDELRRIAEDRSDWNARILKEWLQLKDLYGGRNSFKYNLVKYVSIQHIHALHSYLHNTCMHTYTRRQVHTYTNIHIHTYKHIHIHTYIQKYIQFLKRCKSDKSQEFEKVSQYNISYKITAAQTIIATNNFPFFAGQEINSISQLSKLLTSKFLNLFYVVRKNSSALCKFYIRWRLSSTNYFPSLQFSIFTFVASTNHSAPFL